MQYRLPVILVAFLFSVACSEREPTLSIESLQVVAPAPGRSASVAYMTVINRGPADRTLTDISSPQFGRVQMHETTLDDGVSSMRAVADILVAANSEVALEPFGRHVMLLDPVSALLPGTTIRLQVQFDAGEILIVETSLATRLKVE